LGAPQEQIALDITDPVALSSIVQTAVVTLTLVIFILSFRSQDKAIREGAYQKVLDDYTDTIRMLIDKPELRRLQVEIARTSASRSETASASPEDMIIRNYVLLLYGLMERIHLLFRKNWIDKETWSQWSAFLEILARHPMFVEVHRSSEGMFDKPFREYVSNILNRRSSDEKAPRKEE
jgi:hypothetical protein